MIEPLPRILFVHWPGSRQKIMILNDDWPIIGRVFHFQNPYRMHQFLTSKGPLYEIVKGYSIAVFYGGVLGNSHDRPDAAQIDWALNELANFYFENKIKQDLPAFEKYSTKGWWLPGFML